MLGRVPAYLTVASAKAKAVTKISIHQSKAKKLVEKVVAPAPASASPGSFLYAEAERSRTHGKGPAIAIDTSMKTFHEWLAERERRQCEGLWLNDKNAVIGLLKMNPLPRDSAVNKSLSKKPKPPPTDVPVFKPWKPAQPAKLQHFKMN